MKKLIIDNFLDNPDSVREFALKQKYRPRSDVEFFEGIRSPLVRDLDFNLSDNICRKIISNYYCIKKFQYNADLYFHKTRFEDNQDFMYQNDRVHKDKGMIASLIYLTPNAPLTTGTQTYVYNESENHYYTDIVMSNVYNRLVVYPSDVAHSAMGYFGDNSNPRLVLLFWLYQLEKLDE